MMWTELLFLCLSVLHCAVSSSPPTPVNVSFSSVNLRNVLHWSPGSGTPDGTHFAVEYIIYGESTEASKGKRGHWRAVQHCTNIVRTWCDLSLETWDEEKGYLARVRALGRKSSSKWTLTKRRFDPKWDTILGPPLVSVRMKNNSAIITLKGPMRYSPNNDTPPLSMKSFYHRMSYNLSIYIRHRNQMYHFPLDTSQYKYQLLEYNTEYCFFAKSRFLSIPMQCKSSAWHCIITPQDPVIKQLQQVVVGIVVPSLCIFIIGLVSYLLYNYVAAKEQKIPPILKTFFHQNHSWLPPDYVNLQLARIIPVKPPQPTEIPLIVPPPEAGYLSQGPHVPQEPEEPMNDSSVDYSFVAPKKAGVGDEGTGPSKQDEGDGVNNLTGELQKCPDSDKENNIDIKDDGNKPQPPKPEPAKREINAAMQTGLPSKAQDPIQSNQRSCTLNVHLGPPLIKEEERREASEESEQNPNQCENDRLLSGYVSQRISTIPRFDIEQFDRLSDDYGHLISGGREDKKTENCELDYVTRRQLNFESLIVRQTSQEAQVEEEIMGEADDILSKWDLVISVDE
ncbi:interleukin-20 receptor subunit alpha [Cyprinodon tularosa]|uniref:interleukin-20 receptor subunit alpha n=1 Tax=Cyprinodon tularosa TaxID=77115 RepID=UPI0018E2771A|nr:interleukin-20 receptor subunit alpha [Cyprinodon tularosa]